jgi:hypothetical protein
MLYACQLSSFTQIVLFYGCKIKKELWIQNFMAFVITSVAEFNTVITMLGFIAASIQASTGVYAAIYKKKTALLRTNEVLWRSHRLFGSFATLLFFLGLFQGVTGFIQAIINPAGGETPAFEPERVSFNLHVWISFPITIIILGKTFISYFSKKTVFKQGKWLGIATFTSWMIMWITSAIAFYANVEGLPWSADAGTLHKSPGVLLPSTIWGIILQIFIPFIVAALISWPILVKSHKLELEKERKRQQKQ